MRYDATTLTTLAAFGLTLLLPRTSGAQDTRSAVPFTVGEELTYKATLGKIRAGTARILPNVAL